MGCASSKPSSSSKDKHKKNIKSKQNVENGSKGRVNEDLNSPKINGNHPLPSQSKPINLSPSVVEQIESNSQQVINYIGQIVHRELNAELISHGQSQKAPQISGANAPNMAAVVLAASVAKENDDLIQDVAAKAVYLLTSKNMNYRPSTYQHLNESLKATEYLFKNQTNKNRIIDLTVDTIESSVDAINQEINLYGTEFSLVEFLRKNHSDNDDVQQLTPPHTPERDSSNRPNQSTPFIDWDNAELLSRAQALEVARKLFLSNKAQPIVHASPKTKDSYIVNKQVNNTEIALSKDEIDEILNRYDDQPKYIELVENYQIIDISPITPQKLKDILTNKTPHLSSFTAKSANLTSNLNELVDTTKNEELTDVTQDDTMQFELDTQESMKKNQLDIEYSPDGTDDQQADNASSSDDKNPSLFVTETNIIITENCVLNSPSDTDNNLGSS